MANRRKKIPLSPDEDNLLRQLYLHFRIPRDQYPKRPADLEAFISAWNDLTGRTDTSDEIKHYIVSMAKASMWVTFDGNHERMGTVSAAVLSLSEWKHLAAAYKKVCLSQGFGSCPLAYEPELRNRLAREFFKMSGRKVTGELLHSLIEAKRKRGWWITGDGDRGLNFGDINDV